MHLKTLIILAGVGHIGLGLSSLLIPKFLSWKESLAQVPTLIRQMFWTYAGYILGINFFFGIISIAYPEQLLSSDPLSRSLLVLIVLYWLARVIIQFTYFDKKGLPEKKIYTYGEFLLNGLFLFFVAIYGWALIKTL